MSPKPTLAYWNIRGYAEPIRMLLHYLNVEFEDKAYPLSDDMTCWTNEKFTLGLDFPNLPYYIEGDLKLTQTLAILRYIARKHKLDGDNDVEFAKIAMLEQQLIDNRLGFNRVAYDPEKNVKNKEEFLKNLPSSLELLSKFLKDQQFGIGQKISYVDFYFYEYLALIHNIFRDSLAKFDNLKQYITRFEALPQLQTYLKSRKPRPFNGHIASLNATY